MDINIFELASRKKIRYETGRGLLPVETLWDLPLTSTSGWDLDSIGQGLLADLDALNTRSLVNTKPNPRIAELELKIELIKHVIKVKQDENAARLAKAEKQAKRTKLIEQLGKKQDAAIEALSEEDIKKQLAELDD